MHIKAVHANFYSNLEVKLIFKYFSIFILGFIAIAIIGLGFLGWPVADDFCNAIDVLNMGIFGFIESVFYKNSGRIFTTAILATSFAWVSFQYIHIVMACMGALLVCISMISISYIFPGASKAIRIASGAIFSCVFWVLLGAATGEVVYWPTGGYVYLVPLFLLVMSKKMMTISINASQSRAIASYALAFAWYFFLGNSIELLIVPSVTLLTYFYLIYWSSSKRARLILAISSFGFLFGFLLLVTSPGNFVRAGASAGHVLTPSILDLTKNYYKVISWLSSIVPGVRPYSILLFLLFATRIIHECFNRHLIGIGTFKDFLGNPLYLSFLCLCVGYLSYLPFSFVPDFFATRAKIYFVFFYAVSLFYFLKYLLGLINNLNLRIAVILSFGLTAFSIFAYQISNDYRIAYGIRKNYLARVEFIRLHRGEEIFISPLTMAGQLPKHLHFNDASVDPQHWINQCMARYYYVDRISLLSAYDFGSN